MTNSLRYCVGEETGEVVDRLLGPFMEKCIGMNDMAMVNGLIVSAAICIVTHCQRTGEDVQEIADLFRKSFDLALEVASEPKP